MVGAGAIGVPAADAKVDGCEGAEGNMLSGSFVPLRRAGGPVLNVKVRLSISRATAARLTSSDM